MKDKKIEKKSRRYSVDNSGTLGFFQKNNSDKTRYSCTIYDLEKSFYKKIRKIKRKLSKEDIKKSLNKFLVEKKYKVKNL